METQRGIGRITIVLGDITFLSQSWTAHPGEKKNREELNNELIIRLIWQKCVKDYIPENRETVPSLCKEAQGSSKFIQSLSCARGCNVCSLEAPKQRPLLGLWAALSHQLLPFSRTPARHPCFLGLVETVGVLYQLWTCSACLLEQRCERQLP